MANSDEKLKVDEKGHAPENKTMSRRNFFKYAGVSAASVAALGLAGCDDDNNNPMSADGLAITTVNPASGMAGDTITIMGTQFSAVKSNNKVTIGGKDATVQSASGSKLVVMVPEGLEDGAQDITVTVYGNSVTADTQFMFNPKITHVDLGSGDIGILNTAYALEQLEAAFYAMVSANINSGDLNFGNDVKNGAIQAIANHEVAHREFFKAAIPDDKIIPGLGPFLDFNKAGVDFTDSTSVLTNAHALEETGIGAYNGAGQYIQDDAYLVQAGKIVSVEARHTAIINTFLKPDDPTYFAEDVEGSGSTQFGINENGLGNFLTVEQGITNASGYLNTDKLQINYSNVGK